MGPLKISEYPNNILRKKRASVERVTDSEAKLDYVGLLEKMMLFKSKFSKGRDKHANKFV